MAELEAMHQACQRLIDWPIVDWMVREYSIWKKTNRKNPWHGQKESEKLELTTIDESTYISSIYGKVHEIYLQQHQNHMLIAWRTFEQSSSQVVA
jgi:hypothetical protein